MAGKFDPRELIINFAKDNQDVDALQFIRDDPKGIQIKLNEGNGVVNYVYRVKSADCNSSVILKYAEETMRCVPEEKASLERQELEYNCLNLMHNIQPGSAPEPSCLDTKHHILAMADMSDWELLGAQLQKRYVDLEAASDLGRLLARVHMRTTRGNVTEDRWEELKTKFEQKEMKEYIRAFFVSRQFNADDPINSIAKENLEAFQKYVNEIKSLELPKKISDLYDMQTCFIHADCHFNSIFVKDGKTALFDFEFSFLGHVAFNVSLPIACYMSIYIFDMRHATDEQLSKGLSSEDLKTACLQAIRNMLAAYLDTEKDISNSEESRMKFLSDLGLFTGFQLFMLANFVSMHLLLDGLDDTDRRSMMDAGFHVMKSYEKVNTLDEFINILSLHS